MVEEGLALMGSDTNLMVKAKIACKSTASQGFGFVQLPRLLIKSLLADTAWRRLYSQEWSIHTAWLPVRVVSSEQRWMNYRPPELPSGTFTV